MLGVLVLSAAVLGCSAANPSLQPSDVVSHGPTPTDPTSPTPTVTREPVRSRLAGCPGPRPDLALVVALDSGQRLVCFGRAALTFQASAVATEPECVPIEVDPAWLWCPPVAFLASPGTVAGTLDDTLAIAFVDDVLTLEVYAAPGSGVDQAQFFGDAIVLVTGHFDDPAAASCRVIAARQEPGLQAPTAEEVVLACRESFVVTSVRPGST
jgi:hypothetical protein